ncbi:MAG: helix-turn-helix transcriptional regulator [Ignavibacteriales bacterium]
MGIVLENRIKQYREEKKWTQAELAEKMGVKESTISRWETGARAMKISQGFAIAEALGKSLNDIFLPASMPKRKRKVV